jgi:lysophospholipase L1-like esterase
VSTGTGLPRRSRHGVAIGTALRPGNETTFASSTQTNQRQIRRSGAFDGVIDFDAAARDPNRPVHILATFDSGDHLHLQDAGYKAMADSIDLKMLTARP